MFRNECVFSKAKDLENLYSFKKFPIFMGCSNLPYESDIFTDMNWCISKTSGSIQLNPLVPLEILYKNPHNDAVGGLWTQHHHEFSAFICKYAGDNVFEIGGATGILAGNVLGTKPEINWTLLEPNPRLPENTPVKVIRGFLTEDFHIEGDWDTVIHSHTLEHSYDPLSFLGQIHTLLKNSKGRHVFSLPNMRSLLSQYYTNCLNFEHSCFLDELFIDWALSRVGFKILEKKKFLDHSIFYATEWAEPNKLEKLPGLYDQNHKLFMDFVDHNLQIVKSLNEKLTSVDGPVYLFGAHVFSQFLLNFGLDSSKIICILDNAQPKQGLRLYGTKLKVESPEILKSIERPTVILRAANYNKEIKDKILAEINSKVIFWE